MILYGAGGHAKVICDAAESCGTTVDLIVDDDPPAEEIFGIKITCEKTFDHNSPVIIAVGNNSIRKRIAEQDNLCFGTVIHNSAIVSNKSVIGEGTVVFASSVINPDARIGKHCIINTAAIIEHDCVLDDFVHISPNVALAGNVCIGEGTHIGIGACVIPGVKIGKWCVIGAGAVVIKNIPDFCTVVGNPGRIIKTKNIKDE